MINYFSALGTEALFEILRQSSDARAIYTGQDINIQFVNDAMLKLWGKDETVVGKRFEDALPEMEGQVFTGLLKNVWNTGEIYEAIDTPAALLINGQLLTSYFDFIYKPIFDSSGKVYCILHTATDVTERFTVRKALEASEIKLQEYNEELMTLNQEVQGYNEELAALNEEYHTTNEHLELANQKIEFFNEQLTKDNTTLLSDNKGFQDNIQELDRSNKIFELKNRELRDLNKTILQLNEKLSDTEISFTNLISQAPVAMMLVTGDEFVVSMINASMLELIGKDESIVGKRLFDELPELKGQEAADMLIETYKTGIPNADYSNPVLLNRSGSIEKGFFNFTYTPYFENGKVIGVIDMAMEVTPQVTAIQERDKIILEKSELEETIRNSEQRLHSILETMAEGVGVTDVDGQLVYANPMAQQILGLTESKIKERTFDDPQWQNLRLDGTPLPTEEHPMSVMMATGKPVFDHEIGVQPPDRERFYISINAAPLFDKEGNLSGGIGTFMDVTTRRMIAQGKDDFISIASHELKTPVTALKASLQLLQRSNDRLSEETRARLLDQAIKSLEKLSRLINDLLDTSRIEQGQLKIEKSSLSISELFDDCCSTLAQNTSRKIIFESDLDLVVEADNQQVGQVMVNFITNAIKYAPDSDIKIKASKINNNEIMISVQDNGPGIPEQKLAHLFDRYYRTDYKGQKFTGLGLGLYISADIIKNHGGRIGVESTSGKGSKFWFTLPL